MRNLDALKDYESLKIYLASKEDILDWSYGEVTKPETINYRTFKAERDGLYDEKIFGPTKDYQCYCGKYKRIRYKGVICDKCGVEVTHSRVRRVRMGHISLASPVAHVWFFKSIPSKMATLLDISPRSLDSIIYFSSYVVTDFDGSKKAAAISQIEKDMLEAKAELEKELDTKILQLEKEFKASSKEKAGIAQSEIEHKLRQKTQILRDSYAEKMLESEREFRIIQKKVESIQLYDVLADTEYLTLMDYVDMFCQVGIGAEAVKEILQRIDLSELSQNLRKEMESSKGQKALKISKRLKVVEGFRKANIAPDRMIFDVIPVIPPDLRPMVQLEGGRFATSDLNDLYRRVINRNNRLKKLLDLGAPEIIVKNEKRMLQEAVDALFDSSKQRQKVVRVAKGKKQLRSLADMLRGKQGRFRQNLLGKRVDYSGRSVIVNGPELKLNECGIPKEMALELFKPFVLREILSRGLAPNPKSAKFFFETRPVEVFDILEELVKDHPVLLNRAPTLWRLGIQAFYPKLVEGNAIRLHLCVCAGFNADFDGDQMAVHLPLSQAAIAEAKTKMISTANLFKPADGTPMSIPTKIMLFGVYYVTNMNEKLPVWPTVFADEDEAKYVFRTNPALTLQTPIKVRINNEILDTTVGRIIFNDILPENMRFVNSVLDKKAVSKLLSKAFETQPHEVVVALIDRVKDIGLHYGTISGHSVALSDIKIPENREALIEDGKNQVAEVNKNFRRGLITKNEASRLIYGVWNKVWEALDDAAWTSIDDASSIKILLKSGSSRASRDQVKQIAAMKGFIVDPTGKTVELPILGNYKIGLSGLEYFTSSRGARKGLADRALKTADSGYLTRRLVDVAQEVIVREDDCNTKHGRTIFLSDKTVLTSFADRVVGRFLATDVREGGKVIVKRNTLLTAEDVALIEKSGVQSIEIRSPMTCETKRGICTKCYGTDLMTRKVVEIGSAVGIAAAQSIGEPGTQLTMRTFHSGGISGKDITQGLPRVEELVEARAPKHLSLMSEVTGQVKISVSGDERKIYVIPVDKNEEGAVTEYFVDPVAEILVKDGDIVAKGQRLTEGHLDLTDMLRTVGIDATRKYLIDEIQSVFATQGVAINDKHLEVIIRQMFNSVRIEDSGDTSFLPGEIVTKASFQEENENVISSGGNPATAKVTLLGITKASLETDSFLSAASFIQTSTVLTDAAASGKVDRLLGLKENVIVGRLIPTNTIPASSKEE